nr:hypothetical protein GCM10020093_079340 [Planobispora longispora]
MRTPYGRTRHLAEAHGWARRGIAAVVQDVRGRYESGGRWEPYVHEREDGRELLRWVLGRPWCDGRVILYGSSYGAFCAVEAAAGEPEGVAGVISAVPALGAVAREPGGVPKLYSHAWWWTTYGDGRTERVGLLDTRIADDPDALRHLPVTDLPARLGVPLPGWERAWRDPAPPRADVRVPLLSVAGLHDPFLDDAVDLWRRARGPRTLVVGAWQHDLGLVNRERNGDRPIAPDTGCRRPG